MDIYTNIAVVIAIVIAIVVVGIFVLSRWPD